MFYLAVWSEQDTAEACFEALPLHPATLQREALTLSPSRQQATEHALYVQRCKTEYRKNFPTFFAGTCIWSGIWAALNHLVYTVHRPAKRATSIDVGIFQLEIVSCLRKKILQNIGIIALHCHCTVLNGTQYIAYGWAVGLVWTAK